MDINKKSTSDKKKSTAKKPTSYSLSDEAKRLLPLLATKKNRSNANMLETLILEAAKVEGIE